MLTIRREQFKILSEVQAQRFEDWMVTHLRRFFPSQCRALGEGRLRETIDYGIERAAAYAVTSRRDVCKYLDLMLVFGRDFDIDDRLAWAGRTLHQNIRSGAKMRLLVDAATYHLRHR